MPAINTAELSTEVILYVGSSKKKKGINYSGLVPLGNAFITTEDVRISINDTPYAMFRAGTRVYAYSGFTYNFEEDTVILLTREVAPNLSIVWSKNCVNGGALDQNVESDIICSLDVKETTTSGSLEAYSLVYNDGNQDSSVVINIYANGSLVASSDSIELPRKESVNCYFKTSVVDQIPAGNAVHFTLTTTGSSVEVVGGLESPNIVQVSRIS
jgi:hypothetical protein